MADVKELETTTDELMDTVAYELLEESRKLTPGTEEHTVVVGNAIQCYDAYINSTKIGMEYVDRDRQRQHELELRKLDDDREKRNTIIHTAGDVAWKLLGVAAVIGISFLGWKNENDPIYPKTLSSQTSREAKGLISKLLFK